MKRIVFIGSSKWGLRALEVLHEMAELHVVGAITNPPVFKVSYRPEGVRNVNYADVASFCETAGIPVYPMGADEPMKSPALAAQIEAWRPDAFFALGWYHIIPRAIRRIAPVLGIHYSLLPDYAGGAPLVWALINGEKEVGATLFQLDGGVDTGPLLGQVRVAVGERETIATLYPRVGEASLKMMRNRLSAWVTGEATFVPQTDVGRRRFPQRAPADGVIDWGRSALEIDRWVRAQTRPYPGAFSTLNGAQIHIWKATLIGPVAGQPGSIQGDGIVACGDGEGLQIHAVEWGGQTLNGAALLDVLRPGSRLGEPLS